MHYFYFIDPHTNLGSAFLQQLRGSWFLGRDSIQIHGQCRLNSPFTLKNIYIFIYLAAPGLSYSMWGSQLWLVNSQLGLLESSSLTKNQTQMLCIGIVESLAPGPTGKCPLYFARTQKPVDNRAPHRKEEKAYLGLDLDLTSLKSMLFLVILKLCGLISCKT